MKKTFATLLVVVAVLGLLAGCGGAKKTDGKAAGGAVGDFKSVEPVTILFSATFSETETGGQIIKHFADKISELTGGKITANVKFGGTLYSSHDELQAVSSGAVQMIALGHNPHGDMLPLLCSFPDFAPNSIQNALDYFNFLLFKNKDSADLLQAEATKNGVKYLNVEAGGANAFCAKFPFKDLTSMAKGSSNFGNMEAAKFQYIGFKVSPMLPWDMYDAFDRGLVDCTQMALSPMITMSVQEKAKYWMLDNTYTAGNFITVNLEWWNKLSPTQQAAIQAAADDMSKFSVDTYTQAIDSDKETLKKAGCTIVDMSSQDFEKWWTAVFMSKADQSLKLAKDRGDEASVKTILKAAADFTGYKAAF
jgi:TRAP-type transport system periplasmic protein